MYYRVITINAAQPNFPLSPVWVGDGSAAVFWFDNLPANITGISLLLTPVGGGDVEEVAGSVTGVPGSNMGTVYCAAWLFPDTGTTQYEVVLYAADPAGGAEDVAYWAGKGVLTVMAASMEGITPVKPIVPKNSYARDPLTGLYHLITAEQNELGEIVLSVATEGVENV
jgi:hypothetical protein